MIIHCTKKLATKLPNVSKAALIENNPLGCWHANLYLIDGRNCVMFCHDKTRFTLFLSALKKADFANLDFWFQDVYINTLLKLGYKPELLEKAASLLTPLQFDTNCDRSVQGTMRITRFDIDGYLMTMTNLFDIKDVPMYALSADMNHRPVTTKGMKASQCFTSCPFEIRNPPSFAGYSYQELFS